VAYTVERGPHWGQWKGPQPAKEPKSKPPLPSSPYWRVSEVAAFLRVTPGTIYRLIKKGNLKGLRIGGEWRIDKGQLDERPEKD